MPVLKILHVIPNLAKGGAERLVIDICNELTKQKNIQVKLIVFEDRNEFKELSKNIDIEICNSKVIPSILKKKHIDIYHFQKIIETFKPDIVHSHLFEAEIISRWHIYPNIRYFTHCHDNMMQFKNLPLNVLNKKKITNFFEKNLLLKQYKKCNNSFIAISKNTLAYFKTNLSKSFSKRITLLHNAINYQAFSNKKAKMINKKLIHLITIGSLVDKKNQTFLIDVMAYLQNKGYTAKLQIIGEGVNKAKIENKINELRLREAITLRGNVDNVEAYLHTSDIYLHSATYEPFGLVLIEAMASGLPVVCLDGGGNKDIIEQGKNGFILHENDPILFAEKIISLIENKDQYNAISKYAVSYAKKFDIKNYVDKLLEIYRQ